MLQHQELESKLRRQEDRLNLLESDIRRLQEEIRTQARERLRLEALIQDHENWASTHEHPHEHDQSPFLQGLSGIVRLS